MKILKKYTLGFDIWGLIIFLIIMIPNFIWFAVPAPNDILRADYFISWIFYYMGMTNAIVILGLTIPPCLAFLFFAIDRKNMVAVIPISIFAICHLIYGVTNFII